MSRAAITEMKMIDMSHTKIRPVTTKNARVMLTENSSSANPPKTFPAQVVQIVHEDDTIRRTADGFTTRARHPSKIFWVGGTAKELANITNVRIVADTSAILIDGELNTTYRVPCERSGGVEFYVLRPRQFS